MPKVILEFDPYSEHEELSCAQNGHEFKRVVDELLEDLRKESKHQDNPTSRTPEEIRDLILTKIKDLEIQHLFF